ncbi:hypothetical protein LR004_02545 [Candidatus Gracilibacteria bacterium]|nr:hypothetical protein [Candidatus Gracilibacteria bacterium]
MDAKEKKLLFLLVVLTILSFLIMDFNGPFFLMSERKYHNQTDINAILRLSKEDWKLLSFVINLPFVVFLNWVSLQLFFWTKNDCKKYPKYGFLYSLLHVVLLYLVVSLIWKIIGHSSEALFLMLHPLAVLIGIGFFVSNIIFYSFLHLFYFVKSSMKKRR